MCWSFETVQDIVILCTHAWAWDCVWHLGVWGRAIQLPLCRFFLQDRELRVQALHLEVSVTLRPACGVRACGWTFVFPLLPWHLLSAQPNLRGMRCCRARGADSAPRGPLWCRAALTAGPDLSLVSAVSLSWREALGIQRIFPLQLDAARVSDSLHVSGRLCN